MTQHGDRTHPSIRIASTSRATHSVTTVAPQPATSRVVGVLVRSHRAARCLEAQGDTTRSLRQTASSRATKAPESEPRSRTAAPKLKPDEGQIAYSTWAQPAVVMLLQIRLLRQRIRVPLPTSTAQHTTHKGTNKSNEGPGRQEESNARRSEHPDVHRARTEQPSRQATEQATASSLP